MTQRQAELQTAVVLSQESTALDACDDVQEKVQEENLLKDVTLIYNYTCVSQVCYVFSFSIRGNL